MKLLLLLAVVADYPSKLWFAFIGGAISLFAYLILERFKNRVSHFTASINYNSFGSTINDKLFGSIKITHEERTIKHLNFITINVENSSNTDFGELKIVCWVDSRSQILRWQGNYNDSKMAIDYDTDFNDKQTDFLIRLEQESKKNEETGEEVFSDKTSSDLNYFSVNKKLSIPVFNRRSSFQLNFLVENYDGNIPSMNFAIPHKSVEIVGAVDAEAQNRKAGLAMLGYGMLIFVGACIYLFTRESVSKEELIYFAIIGGTYLFWGYLFYRIVMYVYSFFR